MTEKTKPAYVFLFDVETEPTQTLLACVTYGLHLAAARERAREAIARTLPAGAVLGLVDARRYEPQLEIPAPVVVLSPLGTGHRVAAPRTSGGGR